MPRVSAERMFRSHFPDANVQSQRLMFRSRVRTFWVYRPNAPEHSLGEGPTAARAWADACKRHGITALKVQESEPDRAGAGARIIAARIESAGLVVERYHGDLTTYGNGDQARTITVRVPARLIEEQLEIEKGAKP